MLPSQYALEIAALNTCENIAQKYGADYHQDHKYEIAKIVFESFPLSDRLKLQRILKEKGFYKSAIDGQWGKLTAKALLFEAVAHQD